MSNHPSCCSEAIEQMIDRVGLATVLRSIQAICIGKADHIHTNWQDQHLAKQWERAARVVAKAAEHEQITGLP